VKKRHISVDLRRRVREFAQYRCGYCRRTEELAGEQMTVEHIHPESLGGLTVEQNLWLACRRCNEYKGTQIDGFDPLAGKYVRLFNPRAQAWIEHFAWDESGTRILGLTSTGRATVVALRLNNPEIIIARRLWVTAGWWPPEE